MSLLIFLSLDTKPDQFPQPIFPSYLCLLCYCGPGIAPSSLLKLAHLVFQIILHYKDCCFHFVYEIEESQRMEKEAFSKGRRCLVANYSYSVEH